MGLTQRYQTIQNGAMSLIGNSMMNTLQAVISSSADTLKLPPGSTVTYAEVGWYRNTNQRTITLITPAGSNTITSVYEDQSDGNWWFGAPVTDIVNQAKGGVYTVSFTVVPPSEGHSPSWSLIVVYENPSLPYRYMSVKTGNGYEGTSATYSGFTIPAQGSFNAYLLACASRGNSGDVTNLFIDGNNIANPSNAWAAWNAPPAPGAWNGLNPYNPQGNTYISLYCGSDGNDISTLGLTIPNLTYTGGWMNDRNQVVGNPSQTAEYFDKTGFNITKFLTSGQNSLLFEQPVGINATHALGLQIDSRYTNLSPFTKTVSKNVAVTGDTLDYTVSFTNQGPVTISSATFVDTIPSGTSYITNSTAVNGVPSSYNITPPGISFSTIAIGETVTITFKANVTTVPTINPVVLQNTGELRYTYEGVTSTSNSSTATTTVPLSPSLNQISKVSNRHYGQQGDTITYTIAIPNTGGKNALNVVLKDTLPSGVTFVANSVNINGVNNPGADIQSGINLLTIPSASTVTVTFDVTITTIVGTIINSANVSYNHPDIVKSYYNESPNVLTTVSNAIISSVKTASPDRGTIGDTITYSIAISNAGNISANVYLLDTLPSGLTLVSNSAKQDLTNIPSPGNIAVTLPNQIAPNSVSTVTFSVSVTSIPNPNPFENIASIRASYIADPTTTPNRVNSNTTNSSASSVNLGTADLSSIVKSSNTNYATCLDFIDYTIVYKNTGNQIATKVVFYDTLPNNMVFVPNSFVVNGISLPNANIGNGVTLPNIGVNETATITFKTQIQC